MINLLDLGFGLLELGLSKFKSKFPLELAQAAQAAVDAWSKHRNDVINRENLEAQRG